MSAAVHPTLKSDPVSGFFHWGARYFDAINTHAYILGGVPDREVLAQALSRAIRRFGLLQHRAGERGSIVPIDECRVAGEVDFENADLRRLIMQRVTGPAARVSSASPFHLLLVMSDHCVRSCLHLAISHAVADVKSGNQLMAALIDEYQHLQASGGRLGDDSDGRTCPVVPLAAMRPDWYRTSAVLKRRARAYVDIAKRMTTRDRTRVGFARAPSGDDSGNDFFHSMLPAPLQEGVLHAASQTGVTVNSVFSAALVRYIAAHQPHSSKRVTYSFALSLRKLLGGAHEDGFRSYMVPCTVRMEPLTDIRALLHEVDRRIGLLRSEQLCGELGRMENAVGLYRNGFPSAVVRWVMRRTQGTNIFYSNPGVIEEDFSCFGSPKLPIYHSLAIGCLVHPYDLMFYTSTFGGRTQLDVVFRRAVFPDIRTQFVVPFLQAVAEVVVCCGVPVPVVDSAASSGHQPQPDGTCRQSIFNQRAIDLHE